MINRKAAVIGGRSNHWISTRGMRSPVLRLSCPEGTQVLVDQLHKSDLGDAPAQLRFAGPGVHKLDEALWTRVSVLDGSESLAFIEAEV